MVKKKVVPAIIAILLFYLLLYSRLTNLSWGLPYPFHPDERNMADAIMRLGCPGNPWLYQLANCFDPHFYAYGQFSLYSGYLLASLLALFKGTGPEVSFFQAIMALRIISAFASIGLFYVMWQIFVIAVPKKIGKYETVAVKLLFIFSPVLIQFAHFGTTESLLMLAYALIIYICLLYITKRVGSVRFLLLSGMITGISAGVKVSSVIFACLPLVIIAIHFRKKSGFFRKLFVKFGFTLVFVTVSALFAVVSSPFNLINFNEFRGSMDYETGVARGLMKVFYTRQFEATTPIFFQMRHVFPYALGMILFMLFGAGFFLLSYRKKELNVLRIAFLIAFIPTSFLYAKWTRFIAPAYPISIIIGVLYFVEQFTHVYEFAKHHKKAFVPLLGLTCIVYLFIFAMLPGIAYISIYKLPDVRYVASEWIYKNLPQDSQILSETANVVDMPIQPPGGFADPEVQPRTYRYISFNSYDVDTDTFLHQQLSQHVATADYVFVPSRRVFKNHTCLNDDGVRQNKYLPSEEMRCRHLEAKYPVLNYYYKELFTGSAHFSKAAEFTSYPRIELFGLKIVEFPDEEAEETWTVFDHPVVRIYKR